MRFPASAPAFASSAQVLVWDWPLVPMRPKRTVNEFPSCEISQNLLDPPPVNSKRRALLVATAGLAAGGSGADPLGTICGGLLVASGVGVSGWDNSSMG